jgi:hypothetical protein
MSEMIERVAVALEQAMIDSSPQKAQSSRDLSRILARAAIEAIEPTQQQIAAGWIDQNYRIDRYGVALMMIREGCSDPAGLARRILAEFTA